MAQYSVFIFHSTSFDCIFHNRWLTWSK